MKDLSTQYAIENGIDEDDLWKMVQFEFVRVRETMYSFTTHSIFLRGWGRWFFKVWKIQKDVDKCNGILKSFHKVKVDKMLYFQDLRDKLMNMDYLILKEIIKRDDLRERMLKGHYPSPMEYNNGCRCVGCTEAKKLEMRGYWVRRRAAEELEQFRLEKLKEYESKRKAEEGLGE
jgi:hypothetical protein